MIVKHRSLHLDVIGAAPGIKRLYGDRKRMVIQCALINKSTDWWYANSSKIFADFGTLSESAFAAEGVTPTTGQPYPNMRLVENDLTGEATKEGRPIVNFIYETLTDTWTSEVADETDTTDSGLDLLTRVQVAKAGQALPSPLTVGTTYITVGSKKLYLSGKSDKSTDRIGRVITRWSEPGILSVQTPKVGGAQQVQLSCIKLTEAEVKLAIATVVTSKHKLISEGKGSYNGLQTIDYTFEVDDFEVLSATDNGLKQVTRTQLSATAYTRATIGSIATEPASINGLYLAGEEIDNGGTIKKRVSRWSEAGLVNKSGGAGPSSIPGTRMITLVSQGLEYYPKVDAGKWVGEAVGTGTIDGTKAKLTDHSDGSVNGFTQYSRTYLVSADTTKTIEGEKFTYQEYRNVDTLGTLKPVTISAGVANGGTITSDTIALIEQKPKGQEEKLLNVSVHIYAESNLPAAEPRAFNSDVVACSMTITRLNHTTATGNTITIGSETNKMTLTGWSQSLSVSGNVQTLKGYAIEGAATTISGSVAYQSSASPFIAAGSASSNVADWTKNFADSKSRVDIVQTGDAADFKTTGMVLRKPRPVFTTADGTVYWEVITWRT